VESPLATIELGSSLEYTLGALMRQDSGVLGVTSDGQLLGVLTPLAVHTALRRSIAESADPT
jgi:hypothetical protein